MAKSTQSTEAGQTPEQLSVASAERLDNLQFMLDLMIQRRKTLGDYNADAADILAIAHTLRAFIEAVRGKL